MGKSGESAERLLLHRGFKRQDVLTFDQKSPAQFSDAQMLMREGMPRTLVVSPGVPLSSEWIQSAIESGVQVTSEINLACESLADEKLIGITGSLGKSTTVSLLGAGLLAFDKNGFVGGNLGTPFCDYVYEVETGARKRAQWILLELSSYQLENSAELKLDHAAITFLSPNHMERYDSLEDYYLTKWRIIDQTSGNLFINSNGGELYDFAHGQAEFDRCIVCLRDDKALQPHALSHSKLLGSHNQDNIALAAKIAIHCHWPISSIQGIKAFKGLEHRLENVGLFDGIQFINDSKATAMNSVLTAAEVVHEGLSAKGQLFVLLGGKDKSLPWEELQTLALLPRIQFLFFGNCGELAKSKSKLPGDIYEKLDHALDNVFLKSSSGDIVLLSPGGTSFDEFKGFEDRGRFFKEKIRTHYS
ncbi:MAG: UDP-N-acetylmuramoyl-L-alanine--D-glutamate ligase [Bdellovibrionaceae bacterium]|nr:UDP-N-acetylmuramoyl-L-alanine--D-glutamate ligase [Pseudobdellovibrionaceae bacterium]